MVDKSKFAEEDALGYQVDVLGRSVYVTEAMKNYALEKIAKIEKLQNHLMDVHVTMDIQKLQHSVTILVHFSHFKIKVSATTTDMYASIDKAVDKLQNKIRRWKGKIQDHHKKPLAVVDMHVNIVEHPFSSDCEEINAEIDEANLKKELEEYKPPKVIGTETRPLKILNTQEAIMKLDLSGDHFKVFRCEEDRKIKVIYRRSDGNFGIIAAE